jgi:hypothetical protein
MEGEVYIDSSSSDFIYTDASGNERRIPNVSSTSNSGTDGEVWTGGKYLRWRHNDTEYYSRGDYNGMNGTPSNLNAQSNNEAADLSWDTPEQKRYIGQEWIIYRRESGAVTWNQIGTTNTLGYIDSNATAGKTYDYYVEEEITRTNGITESAQTSTVSLKIEEQQSDFSLSIFVSHISGTDDQWNCDASPSGGTGTITYSWSTDRFSSWDPSSTVQNPTATTSTLGGVDIKFTCTAEDEDGRTRTDSVTKTAPA